MPTIRLWGHAFVEDATDAIVASFPAWIDVTTTSAAPTFTYTLTPGGGPFDAAITGFPGTARLFGDSFPFVTGHSFDAALEDADLRVFEAVWGDNFATQVMEFSLPGQNPGETAFFYFRLGGLPFPAFTVEELLEFYDADLSTIRPIGPLPLQPGTPIALSAIPDRQSIPDSPTGDSLSADTSPDTVVGGTGNDTIFGSVASDLLQGGDGNDLIDGDAGADLISGQGGADMLFGLTGNDTIAASTGDDFVFGEGGNDLIGGGDGSDRLFGNADNDVVLGGPGDDAVHGNDGDDFVSGGLGNDTLYGGEGRDNLASGPGNDVAFGGAGNDSIGGGDGNDFISAGAGNDLVGAGNGNDTVYGHLGNDTLNGGAGDDKLFGNPGDDVLNGGAGSDVLDGGAGADIYVFGNYSFGATDEIVLFENGVDRIQLGLIAGATAEAKFASLDLIDISGGVALLKAGNLILIGGVSLGDLDVSDFIFV